MAVKIRQRAPAKRKHFTEENVLRLPGKRGKQARVRELSGIPDFFLHGVRHLAETKCAELKLPPPCARPAFRSRPQTRQRRRLRPS